VPRAPVIQAYHQYGVGSHLAL